jgi:hypothetical protein
MVRNGGLIVTRVVLLTLGLLGAALGVGMFVGVAFGHASPALALLGVGFLTVSFLIHRNAFRVTRTSPDRPPSPRVKPTRRTRA